MTVTTKDKMSMGKAFVVFYVGLLVALVVIGISLKVSPRLTATLLVALLCAFGFFWVKMTAMARAELIHKCFDMGEAKVGRTAFLLLLSAFLAPLFPVMTLPIVALTVVQMARGKCDG